VFVDSVLYRDVATSSPVSLRDHAILKQVYKQEVELVVVGKFSMVLQTDRFQDPFSMEGPVMANGRVSLYHGDPKRI
jgi:hypothetical protein